MKHKRLSIVWFRQDLRLADNPALVAASQYGGPILPLYIWESAPLAEWAMGAASRWWLHQSLSSLDKALRTHGSRLTICRGDYLATLQYVIRKTGATAVFWNRIYEPTFRRKDREIITHLEQINIRVKTFNGSWLCNPDTLFNKSGKAYQVFTPFWTHCFVGAKPDKPLLTPQIRPSIGAMRSSVRLSTLELEPKTDWATGFRDWWAPGESGANQQFVNFLNHGLVNYDVYRDRPDLGGSSRLSPHLHFGEISPRQVWHAVESQMNSKSDRILCRSSRSFLRQLGWREFANYLLYHFPYTTTRPLRKKFETVPWQNNGTALNAWQRGQTGYPLVDAGMRELWASGWMHNRVRMLVASFLTKHLQISWQRGAEWFWDTLLDADLANNTLGWQWVAGCGADAAPYFRIFNPVSQGLKFDPNGDYVRRWVPELARLPYPWIHKPWEAPPLFLKEGGVVLGRTYPFPIVDHRESRERALQMFAAMAPSACPSPSISGSPTKRLKFRNVGQKGS